MKLISVIKSNHFKLECSQNTEVTSGQEPIYVFGDLYHLDSQSLNDSDDSKNLPKKNDKNLRKQNKSIYEKIEKAGILP